MKKIGNTKLPVNVVVKISFEAVFIFSTA